MSLVGPVRHRKGQAFVWKSLIELKSQSKPQKYKSKSERGSYRPKKSFLKPHQVSELAQISFYMPQLALSIQEYTIKIDYRFYINSLQPKTAKIGENVHFLTISTQYRVKYSHGILFF